MSATRDSVPQADEVRIVTDGACRGNPGPGGWAAIIREGDTLRELGGREARTTNNRMELRAAVEALRQIAPGVRVLIVSDSRYLIDGATKWIKGWRARGWMTRDETPVEHRDLWEELDRLAGRRVRWEYVRGHAGHPENERADQIAQAYADGRPHPPAGAAGRPPTPSGAPASRTPATAPSDSRTPSTAPPAGRWPIYLSLVAGRVARHATWDECRARVHGVSGARFKKCGSPAEAEATLAAWGVAEAGGA